MATQPTPTQNKPKKSKGVKLPLNIFLGGETIKQPNWAEEVEHTYGPDNTQSSYGAQPIEKLSLPKEPRAAREQTIDLSKVPNQPPFTAFVGNLPYEVSETLLHDYFSALKVKNVRLIADNGRFKGYGYVEFESRECLIEALRKNDELFSGRKMRVDLATASKDNDNRRNDRHSHNNQKFDDDKLTNSWRSTPSNIPPSRDTAYDPVFNCQDIRFINKDENSNKRNNYNRDNTYTRNNDRRFDNRNSYDQQNSGHSEKNENYRQSYSRQNRSNKYEPPRNGHQRRDDESFENRRSPTTEERPEPLKPAERPRLKLQPRTKSNDSVSESGITRPSSIFGDAKPVDTATKEREIEEKLVREREQQEAVVTSQGNTSGSFKRNNDRRDSGGRRERRISSGSNRGNSRQGSNSDMRVRAILRRPTSSTSSLGGSAKQYGNCSVSSTLSETDTAPPGAPASRISISEGENDVFDHNSNTQSTEKSEGKRNICPAPVPKENPWTLRSKKVEVSVLTGVQTTISDSVAERRECLARPPQTQSNDNFDKKSDDSFKKKNKSPSNSYKKDTQGRGQGRLTTNDDSNQSWRRENHSNSRPPTRGGKNINSANVGKRTDKKGAPGGPVLKEKTKRNEKPASRKVEELPKYVEEKQKDFSDVNKFSHLMDDNDDNDEDVSDDRDINETYTGNEIIEKIEEQKAFDKLIDSCENYLKYSELN